MTSKMLNISKQIHAGWFTNTVKYDLPEAEVIPGGTSANEKKKIVTAKGRYNTLNEYENIPLPGFTLYKSDRKNWGSLDQTWLVIDPRGFLVRISSKNLENILHVTGITEGLIQEKCVWARENSETKLTLVPVSSPFYIEAVDNTELIEGKVSMKDVQIGDTVLLQNKLQGRYMGTLSLYGPVYDYSNHNENKAQVHLRRQIIEVDPGRYFYQSDIKILKVVEKSLTPMSREDSAEFLNLQIASGNAYFGSDPKMTGKYYGVAGVIKHVSVHAVPKVDLRFEEIDKVEAFDLFHIALVASDFGMLLLQKGNGQLHGIDFPYTYALTNSTTVHAFNSSPVLSINLAESTNLLVTADRRSSIWGINRAKTANESLDNFVKFYKIVKYVKGETYV